MDTAFRTIPLDQSHAVLEETFIWQMSSQPQLSILQTSPSPCQTMDSNCGLWSVEKEEAYGHIHTGRSILACIV